MKLIYITNTLNHHTVSLCDTFNKYNNIDFQLILTEDPSVDRKKYGYSNYSNYFDNVIFANIKNRICIESLCYNCDILILGHANIFYAKRRLLDDKLTFRFSERLFKKGFCSYLKQKYLPHENNKLYPYKDNKNFYMLCASYYAPFDFVKLGLKKEQQLKWGYFPPVETLNIQEILNNKSKDIINILWVGRFLDWKHPEFAIKSVEYLCDNNIKCQLNIIGMGEQEKNIRKLINKLNLNNNINLLGNMPAEKVRKNMENNHIFLFTSDKKEGWGAVLNEAMSSGCCPIVSSAAGSTNYLVKDGFNGLVYNYPNQKQLNNKLLYVAKDKEFREKLTLNAYNTMYDLWNGKIAAKRLISISESILKGNHIVFDEGPCSFAFKEDLK